MNIKSFAVPAVALLLILAAARAEDAGQRPESQLASAAERKRWTEVEKLLEQKTNANTAQPDGMTALHWATYHDEPKIAKRLLELGADPNATTRYGVTALSIACTNGSAAIIKALLDAKADPNTKLPGDDSCLMLAARTGFIEPVKLLIANNADANAQNRKKQTAIMWAAAEGNTEVVDLLIKSGADFRASLPSGFTPLFFAVREGKSQTVFKLIEAGLDVNERTRPERPSAGVRPKQLTPLILAIENGHFQLAADLLKADANPNDAPAGYTALHAVSGVRKPIRGDGDPPPIGSGNLSSLDLVRKLVEHQADLNAKQERGTAGKGRFNTTGCTPFMLAARASDVPLMRLLLELGADSNIPNADKCTPLMAAAGVGALGDGDEAAGTDDEAMTAVKLLLELGADLNAVDDNGETAMHGASYQNRANLVQLFADRGADIKIWNQKNNWGWTPYDIALGHRPGNFRPEPETLAVLDKIFRAADVSPSAQAKPAKPQSEYP
jgi:uncharacterized protein